MCCRFAGTKNGGCDDEMSVRWGPTVFVLMRGLCFLFFCRYDVELYQRIEQLIEKKLPLYPTVEEEVMLLMERVTEAQRYAKMVRGCMKRPSDFFYFHHSSPLTDVPVFPRSLIRLIVHRVQNSLCDSLGEIPTCNTSRKSLFFNVPLYVVPPLGENCSLSSLSFRQTKDLEIRNFIVAALTLYNRSRVLGI